MRMVRWSLTMAFCASTVLAARKICFVLASLILVVGSCPGASWYVDPGNGSDANAGHGWGSGNALLTLTNAVAKSSGADTINVAAGTYSWTNGAGFVIDTQTILGGYPSGGGTRDWVANPTILDGSNKVAGIRHGNAGTLTIDGFSIVNFTNSSSGIDQGGALTLIYPANILNCTFTNNCNSNDQGGGAIETRASGVLISNCTFQANFAGGNAHYGQGGAICFNQFANGAATLWNCAFVTNWSILRRGGAIEFGENNATVTALVYNCTFLNNTTRSWPGGAINDDAGRTTLNLTNCIFWQNKAVGSSGQNINLGANGAYTAILNMAYCDLDTNSASVNGGIKILGAGILNTDPLMACTNAPYDWHLLSQGGRYSNGVWVIDAQTSPCMDAGDPASAYGNEPQPNGKRVNLGAYGNTAQASVSYTAYMIALGTNGAAIAVGDAASAVKGSDFGTISYGAPVANIFTITNAGNRTLYLTGNPAIGFSGVNAGDFSTNGTAVATNLVPGATTTFQVQFNPQLPNLLRTATVVITNSDSADNPFTFALSGTGFEAGVPSISVLGTNGAAINNGDPADAPRGADFGMVITNTPSDHLFVVTNAGAATLTLTGSTIIAISGANPGDFFTNGTAVATNIAAGASSTVQIRFQPTALGVRTALVTIRDNVAGLDPYTFSLRGIGINGSGISVAGTNSAVMTNNEAATVAKGTDFGTVLVNSLNDHVFTVNSTGGGSLNLTGATTVAISGNTADFFTNGTAVSTNIGSGGSSTFQIRFQPTVMGVRTALVTIANDTTNANPYTFALRGTGDSGANLLVLGTNGLAIASGGAATTTNGADFGENFTLGGGAVTHTFTITNSGVNSLLLSGSPCVALSGDARFTLQSDATTPVGSGATTTFTIQFNPSVAGPHKAQVSIANNTLTTSPYTFTVQAGIPVTPMSGVSYVNPAATLTPENGSDWLHAYRTITNAMASTAGVFWVAGTYTVPAVADLKTNTLYGGFQGGETALSQRSWTLHPTIVDGGLTGSAFRTSMAGTSTLDGFTVVNCANSSGGGALTVGNVGNVYVYNSVFTNNFGDSNGGGGGAIQIGNATILLVSNCTFFANVAGPSSGAQGGAVCFAQFSSGTGVFWNCAFVANSCAQRRGGAVDFDQAPGRVVGTFINCTFLTNSTPGWEGAAIDAGQSTTILNVTNCIFWGNNTGGGRTPYTINIVSGRTLNMAYCDINTNSASVSGYASVGTLNYGAGITNADPLFASAVAPYDLHLKSVWGRWYNNDWVTDGVSSPFMDAGDPASSYALEPRASRGIELGFYGNTPQASKSVFLGGTQCFFR